MEPAETRQSLFLKPIPPWTYRVSSASFLPQAWSVRLLTVVGGEEAGRPVPLGRPRWRSWCSCREGRMAGATPASTFSKHGDWTQERKMKGEGALNPSRGGDRRPRQHSSAFVGLILQGRWRLP